MKVIVDAGFPPLNDIRCMAMRVELYKQKKRYAYKELENGAIYIHFPRINPIVWLYQNVKYYLYTRYTKDEEDNGDGGIPAE